MAKPSDFLTKVALGVYPPFFILLLYIILAQNGPIEPFSMAALTSPFFGGSAVLSIGALAFSIFEVFLIHLYIIPQIMKLHLGSLIAFAISAVISLLGFVTGFAESNFWIIFPFAILGFATYMSVFMRLGGFADPTG